MKFKTEKTLTLFESSLWGLSKNTLKEKYVLIILNV